MPRPYRVLFLCTGNSARSILAEATLNQLGEGRFIAYSAGSFPTGRVNPFSLELLARKGWPITGLRSKRWDEFALPGAPEMDFIITVCANAAGETCPVWPGQPTSAHWGFDDPAAAEGSDDGKRAAFAEIHAQITRRIERLLALPLTTMSRAEQLTALRAIGDSAP